MHWMPPSIVLRLGLSALTLAGFASAQVDGAATRKSAETRPEPADQALRLMDEGLNDVVSEGLKSLRFSYRPTATGMPLPDFRVQVAWKKDGSTEVSFLTPDKKPLDRSVPHPWLDAEDPDRAGRKMSERYVEGGKALLGLFLRPTYSVQFAAWRKRLETRTVNGRPESTLVLEPAVAERFRRVEIRLGSDGRAQKITQTLVRPIDGHDVDVLFPKFEPAGGKLVLKSFQQETSGRTDQVVFEYQKVSGFVLLASVERIVKDSKVGGSKTEFDDIEAAR